MKFNGVFFLGMLFAVVLCSTADSAIPNEAIPPGFIPSAIIDGSIGQPQVRVPGNYSGIDLSHFQKFSTPFEVLTKGHTFSRELGT